MTSPMILDPTINNLNNRVLLTIFSFLPFEKNYWSHWSRTCKRFNQILHIAIETMPCAGSYGNLPIKRASDYGNADAVRKMLRNPYVNPAVSGNAPVQYASWSGQVDVVKALLEDPRVNPADLESYVLDYTIENGHWEVLNELLEDGRVNLEPKSSISRMRNPLINAIENNHWDIAVSLLKHPKLDPTADNYHALEEAYRKYKVGVVFAILEHPKTNSERLYEVLQRSDTGWQFIQDLERFATNKNSAKVLDMTRKWKERLMRK